MDQRILNQYEEKGLSCPFSLLRSGDVFISQKGEPLKKELSQLLSKFITKSIKYDLRRGNRNEALKSWFFFLMHNIKNPLSYKLLKKIILLPGNLTNKIVRGVLRAFRRIMTPPPKFFS